MMLTALGSAVRGGQSLSQVFKIVARGIEFSGARCVVAVDSARMHQGWAAGKPYKRLEAGRRSFDTSRFRRS
jgi:hypothetical protein